MKRSGTALGARRRGRLYAGLAGLALSLGYGLLAVTDLPMGKISQPGAAVFPVIVALVMAAASVGLVLEQLVSAAVTEERPMDLPRGADLRRLLAFGASIAGYVLLAPVLGHLPASAVLCIALVRLLKPASWRSNVVTGVAIAIAAWAFFDVALGVSLPKGVLD